VAAGHITFSWRYRDHTHALGAKWLTAAGQDPILPVVGFLLLSSTCWFAFAARANRSKGGEEEEERKYKQMDEENKHYLLAHMEEGVTETTPLKSKGGPPAGVSHEPTTGKRREKISILQRSYPHRYIDRHEPTLEEYNTSTKSENVNRILFQMAMRWTLIKSFCSLITVGGIVIIVLTVISTMLCYHYDFEAALPLTFLGTGVFFPISFGYLLSSGSAP
jgi:hypothetical protein